METKRGFTKTNILITIILCLLVIACVYVVIKKRTSSVAETPTIKTNTYGMSQYVDSHGFSFWYPSALSITTAITEDTTNFPGDTSVESLQVGPMGGVNIFVVDSDTSTITDEPNNHASPIAQTKYFYDSTSDQWMVTYPEGTDGAMSSTTTTADISKTTISGLVMLPSGRRFDTTIIPLSTTQFIVISDGGGSSFTKELAKTVIPTSAVIDPTIQSAALQTEAAAYAGGATPDNTTSNLMEPTINSLQPNSGVVGTSITITGSGFTPTGNKIKFGDLGMDNDPKYILNSSDGKTIIFPVPLSNYLACWAKGCESPALLTQPGIYDVSVINDNGASNTISFTIVPTETTVTCTPAWQCGWSTCSNGYQTMNTIVDSNNCGTTYQNSPQIACPALARACN